MDRIDAKLTGIARQQCAVLPTPVHELPALAQLSGCRVFCKRDDLSGFGFGGNKARKLDFLIAEAMLGHSERAWEYFRAYLPAAANDNPEVRESEPYVWCQSTHGKFSRLFGKARLPWLSGTASWSYFAATHHILGVRPDYDGLVVDPCIPKHWDGFEVRRVFRGSTYRIKVLNPSHVSSGVKSVKVGRKVIAGNVIPPAEPGSSVRVEVVMG